MGDRWRAGGGAGCRGDPGLAPDGQRFNQLVRLGVDGITTANLAILRTLGDREG